MQTGFPGIQFDGISLAYYSLIIVAAWLGAMATAVWLARRHGIARTSAIELGLSAFVVGVVAARLFFVLWPPPSVSAYYTRDWYLSHPLDMLIGPLAVWSGGLDNGGALIGALAGAAWASWRNRLRIWEGLALIAPASAVFLIIAPWANYLNQQLLGPPTALPWGVVLSYPVPQGSNLQFYGAGTRLQPVPAYLSLAQGLLLAVCSLIPRARPELLSKGAWLVTQALGILTLLFLADLVRIDVSRIVVGLTVLQIAVILASGSIAVLAYRRPIIVE